MYKTSIPKESTTISEELEQFNIHIEDVNKDYNLIENIDLAVNNLKKHTLTDRFEVILNNNLIESKDKLTNFRTILGCRISYDNLDKEISFIIKEDTKPSYDKLETKLRHIEQYFDDLDDIDYKTIKYEVEKILKKDK